MSSRATITRKRRNGILLSYKGKATFAMITCDSESEANTTGDKIEVFIFSIKYAKGL
jgi:hypothetical protein